LEEERFLRAGEVFAEPAVDFAVKLLSDNYGGLEKMRRSGIASLKLGKRRAVANRPCVILKYRKRQDFPALGHNNAQNDAFFPDLGRAERG